MAKGEKQGNGFIIANGAGMSQAVADILLTHQTSITKVLIYQHNDVSKDSDTIPAGERFTNDIMDALQDTRIIAGTMNELYAGYKDLNDWWMTTPKLKMNSVKP